MARSRFAWIASSALLAGCVGLGTSGTLAPKANDLGAGQFLQGPPATVTIAGVVTVPSLVSNNSNFLVGNNANNLVANNAGALVGNNANAFRTQTIDQAPLAGMQVDVIDQNGKRLSGATSGTTDAAGKFTLKSPPGVWEVQAAKGQILEKGIVFANTDASMAIDAGSTLVVSRLHQDGTPYQRYGAADLSALIASVAGSLDEAAANSVAGPDADKLAAFAKIIGPANLKASYDKLVAAATAAVAGSSGGTTSGGTTSGGGTAATAAPTQPPSSFSLETSAWSGGAAKTDSDGISVRQVSATAKATLVRAIPAGRTMSFKMRVTGGTVGTSAAYLKLVSADAIATTAKVTLKEYADGKGSNCAANSLSCEAGLLTLAQFSLVVPKDVTSLEFGLENSSSEAEITAITVTP